ncbi:MAG: threonylcarbamoyl-AMP synthase [Treponema sp.]|jgi:L-threonylcarbamoyladenylate synthase|nr:threonylcarbamoyl-AMP synthase [Treponema sp.]
MTVKITGPSLDRAAAILKSGGLVAFPTETVYGLGGDAFNPRALAKIFAAKERPFFDPLIVHVADMDGLEDAADTDALPSPARERLQILSARFWPGPLTLILPRGSRLPGLVTSGLPSVAVRIPSHPAARELIRRAGALAAPSANRFGCLSPVRAEHVAEQLGERVDLVLDGGKTGFGVESTVLDLCVPRILRPGGIARKDIEAAIGPLAGGPAPAAAASPGMLKSHYAPRAPLVLCPSPETFPPDGSALLFFSGSSREKWLARHAPRPVSSPPFPVWTLSESGDTAQAAANLFDMLHELDRSGCTRIYAERAPNEGLGEAINDRLSRASAIEK